MHNIPIHIHILPASAIAVAVAAARLDIGVQIINLDRIPCGPSGEFSSVGAMIAV
jgi:hypothetical protein